MECRIAGGRDNFVAREIDAAREWRVRRARYRESIRLLFEAFTGGAAGLTVDRAVVEELLRLSRGLGDLQRLLTTCSARGFVVVTRAEQLPSLETARLVDWLARHHISRRALIVNAVTPPDCARCRRATRREAREIRPSPAGCCGRPAATSS